VVQIVISYVGGKFPHLPPPPTLRPHFRREIRSVVAVLEVSLIHHQKGVGFGKQPEYPKNFGLFGETFLDGSAHTAVTGYLCSTTPIIGQSAQYTGIFAAPPPILRGK
jgi:hypothetical protein